MKPEIKAMLPDLPGTIDGGNLGSVFLKCEIYDWLDKLTEGAEEMFGEPGPALHLTLGKHFDDTHRYLVIPLGEVKKQTPLEIAVEYIAWAAGQFDSDDLREALAKIEAAK